METKPVDAVAVAAIALVVCFLEPVVHEGLGHGVAALLVGAHLQHVSSVDMSADESGLPAWAVRVVAAAGIVSNLTFGIVSLALFARLQAAGANERYFLWLFGHSNLFVGAGYMLALSFANFGDIQDLVAGLGSHLVIQTGLTALGLAISLATFFHAARTLDEFLGGSNRWRRAVLLTTLPYAVIGITNTLAGALNPVSPLLILVSAGAASFGGNMPIAWLPFAAGRMRSKSTDVPLSPVSDGFWIGSAAVSLILLFAVLAPGVPR